MVVGRISLTGVETDPGPVGGGAEIVGSVTELEAVLKEEDAGVFQGDGGVEADGVVAVELGEGDGIRNAAAEGRSGLVDVEDGSLEGRSVGGEAFQHDVIPSKLRDAELVAADHHHRPYFQDASRPGSQPVEGPGGAPEVRQHEPFSSVANVKVAPGHCRF